MSDGPTQTARGSSRLDDEARKVWQEQFGERYVHVQQQPQQPSRAERRGNRQRRRRR